MKSPRLSTLKSLFARSLNLCAFPGCSCPIAEHDGVITGEVCHIKADSPGGPRYDQHQTDKERHSEGNLILLCSRHHTMVDADADKFPADALLQMKRDHQVTGTPVIARDTERIAEVLLQRYESHIAIHSNNGVIAIASPNAQINQTIHIKTTAKKRSVQFAPPPGSIGHSQAMSCYIGHLISRYQDYQKAHKTKQGRGKYTIIHQAIKREFKGEWKLLPTYTFDDLCTFLQKRIDNTFIGRQNKSKGIKNYSAFAGH